MLCLSCREKYRPDKVQIEEIVRLFGLDNASDLEFLHGLEEQAAKEKIGGSVDEQPLASSDTSIDQLYKEHAGGCEECNGAGYQGRRGIYEVLSLSNDIQKLIVSNATSNDIQEQAIKEGMVTMQMDGLVKVLRGVTSIEEILRVTRE